MGPRTILIDGYNVIRNTPGLLAAERVSLAAGREALLGQIRARYLHTPHTVIVVFDGDGDVESAAAFPGFRRGRVVYSCRGETADSVIERLAASEAARSSDVVVVSNDGQVRQAADQGGQRSAHADALARRLNAPDRYQRKQALHRQHVRQHWEAADDDSAPSRAGNPRRRPRHRRTELDDGLR